ncbi:MAG: MFS transporter [Azorhizobium sp. 39-67-5]|nr:MAG: MFS transporter [Azorhizobium sp. 39-67-5]
MTVVGVLAFAVIALLVPNTKADGAHSSLRNDIAVLTRAPLLLGLATTVLSWVGVFAAFTYIAPMLTRITGFSEGAVSPILLVFGAGLVVGNLLGGRLADWRLVPTVFATLLALSAVLLLLTFALHSQIAAVAFVGLLGAVAFATVAPLQMWVLEKAQGAGQSLASSFNIAAFNLGNAIGAWLGGLVIDHGPGLGAIPWVAALVPLGAMATAFWAVRLEGAKGRRAEPAAAE